VVYSNNTMPFNSNSERQYVGRPPGARLNALSAAGWAARMDRKSKQCGGCPSPFQRFPDKYRSDTLSIISMSTSIKRSKSEPPVRTFHQLVSKRLWFIGFNVASIVFLLVTDRLRLDLVSLLSYGFALALLNVIALISARNFPDWK
jgi:hypothetical protein